MDNNSYSRYAKNIAIDDIGTSGQKILLNSKVIIIGAGGLGCPVALYLSASGVGNIAIADDDVIEISNLQRQIAYNETDIGKQKSKILQQRILQKNSALNIEVFNIKINKENIDNIIKNYEIIIDCTDNFESRHIINASCIKLQKTLISGAISGFNGYLAIFNGFMENQPCFACFCPKVPDQNNVIDCNNNGILGTTASIIGSLQAQEVIKKILHIGDILENTILFFDGKYNKFRKTKLTKDPNCNICQSNSRANYD